MTELLAKIFAAFGAVVYVATILVFLYRIHRDS